MKNAIIAILAVILVVGISGCVSNSNTGDVPSPPTGGAVAVQSGKFLDLDAALVKISDGFGSPSYTKEQVMSLLGEPLETRQINSNLEYWFYESGTDTLLLAFDPDTVSAKRLY